MNISVVFFPIEHRSSSMEEKVNELRDQASLLWLCLGDKHRRWCCQWIHTYIRMSVIWFDWGIYVRVNRDKLSASLLSIDRHRFEKWNKILLFFVWKTRRVSFFSSLSGKTQVNIYLLSLLILNSMYVTRSRQSEGRSFNTSLSTHYRLSKIQEELYNIVDR
jgi:hypothetical protein